MKTIKNGFPYLPILLYDYNTSLMRFAVVGKNCHSTAESLNLAAPLNVAEQ